jgi:aminopeptidase N
MRSSFLSLAVASLTLACASPGASPPSGGAQAPSPAVAAPTGLRLPGGIHPTRQVIALRIDPHATTYAGTVRIELALDASMPAVWLHAEDLRITRATLAQSGDAKPARTVLADPGLLGVIPATPLVAGSAELVIDFEGTLDRERSRAIYRVDEPDGPYVYTFFEPVDARRAFPCFDEPSFKIPWELSLTVPPGTGAYANAPEVSSTPREKGWHEVRFAETRPLPSYLVAFGVGPFEAVPADPGGHHQTPVRFLIPRGRSAELAYARQTVPRMVTLLEDATDVPYPYGKLDVLVVPRFWGTMEHPGLVALGQPLMLIRPDAQALSRKQFGASISVHELAHYWYGDLVTTAWWDDTWLNESFGSWIDNKVTDRLEPTWRWSRRVIRRRQAALDKDALPTAKRLREPVTRAEDIDASFDAPLTYDKGSTVIAMFERWLGEDVWRKAMAGYLRAHADRNVTTEDLLASLDQGTGRDVSSALRTFVEQPGYPLVHVRLLCEAGHPARLGLTQGRYLSTGQATGNSTWKFPLCTRVGKGPRVARSCAVVSGASDEVVLPDVGGCPDWVLADDGGLAYYRVSYEDALRSRLLRLPRGVLSVEERVGLGSDLSALAERGEVPVGPALDLGASLVADADSDVSRQGQEMLEEWLRTDRLTAAQRTQRAAWIRSVASRRARALAWASREGEPIDSRELRHHLVPWVGTDGEDPVLQASARKLAMAWLDERSGVDEDMVETVLVVAAKHGDPRLFEAMVQQAATAPVRVDRTRIVDALGHFDDPALAARARSLLDDPRFDLRDSARILSIQMGRPETRATAWPVLRDRVADLSKKMRSDEVKLLVASVGAGCDRALGDDAERSLTPVAEKIDGAPFALRQALSAIHRCVEVHQRTDAEAGAWLLGRSRRLAPATPPR